MDPTGGVEQKIAQVRVDPVGPEQRSDEELLVRAGAGDRGAYWLLYERFAPRMYGLLLKITNDRTDAEDALQDAAVHLWKSAEAYRPELGTAAAWALMLTRSRGLDLLRKRRRWRMDGSGGEEHEASAQAPAGENAVVCKERTAQVRAAMNDLPDEQRTAIVLAFDHGLTREQIAEVLGVPVGTVKSRVRAAVGRLAVTLGLGGDGSKGGGA